MEVHMVCGLPRNLTELVSTLLRHVILEPLGVAHMRDLMLINLVPRHASPDDFGQRANRALACTFVAQR